MTIVFGQVIFVVNSTVLLVLSMVFLVAGLGRPEAYWRSWALSSLVLALGVVGYVVKGPFPLLVATLVPNGLLILGFGLRWRASREFGGRPAPWGAVYGPVCIFLLLCLLPAFYNFYGLVYTSVNLVLTVFGLLTVWEFLRDRQDGLRSRYPLALAYGLISLSFGTRVVEGVLGFLTMQDAIPRDLLAIAHLILATVYIVASGGFALSLAHDRIAAGLKHAAGHDYLTGLLNRGAFEARLRAHLERNKSDNSVLVLIDIDHFKSINDRFGHAAGDAVLRTCAGIFRSQLEADDFCGRVGGEEFAIVFAASGVFDAKARVDRLMRLVSGGHMAHGDSEFVVTISAGLVYSVPGDDAVAILTRADKLLYAAKKNGRNRAEWLAA